MEDYTTKSYFEGSGISYLINAYRWSAVLKQLSPIFSNDAVSSSALNPTKTNCNVENEGN